jgi:hypothetical protein
MHPGSVGRRGRGNTVLVTGIAVSYELGVVAERRTSGIICETDLDRIEFITPRLEYLIALRHGLLEDLPKIWHGSIM